MNTSMLALLTPEERLLVGQTQSDQLAALDEKNRAGAAGTNASWQAKRDAK